MTWNTIITNNTVVIGKREYLSGKGLKLLKDFHDQMIEKERRKKAKEIFSLTLEEMDALQKKAREVADCTIKMTEIMNGVEDSIIRAQIAKIQ